MIIFFPVDLWCGVEVHYKALGLDLLGSDVEQFLFGSISLLANKHYYIYYCFNMFNASCNEMNCFVSLKE